MNTNRALRRKLRTHKSASMVATSLLATSALLGTYLGNPRLGRAYATGVCTAATPTDFNNRIVDITCTTINITASFNATTDTAGDRTISESAPGAPADLRTSLTINGVGEGITITGGDSINFRLLDNKRAGLSLTISNLTIQNFKFAGDGGAIFSAGDVSVNNSTFSSNTAEALGGGFRSLGLSNVTNSTFSGNTAVFDGGVFYLLAPL